MQNEKLQLPHVCAEWQRGKDKVRVTLENFRGHNFLDIRRWFLTHDGNWAPTAKGISIPISDLQTLAAAVETACSLAAENGREG